MMIDKDKLAARVARTLESIYPEVEEGNFHTALIPDIARRYFFELNLPKDTPILDAGCGQGQFMRLAQEAGFVDVRGVTAGLIDVVACRRFDLNAWQSDMMDIPDIADERVGFLWCRHAIEHSPCPLFVLYEFARVLRPGGQLFIEVPAPDCVRPDGASQEDNPNHYSVMGARMWQSLIKKAGLEPQAHHVYAVDLNERDRPHVRWRETSLILLAKKPEVPDAIEKGA